MQLSKLTALQVLNLEHNKLTGTIPSDLGKLTNLRSLYLREQPAHGRDSRRSWAS